ncbi:Hsp20/alpha crystallin family protein [Desulfuromonas acetoxidans]|uniref:Heat shock protein Hsp20 n=1 Tax=Desulfuromonas acetoxidans (strain DSM 684 / 11070) TaxID=281689 RepID=Q1JXX2_DESA6|nr:Hsp20/alpha crystallin family protein [Desulfuromonas acetoxidans]EAT15021.1 heat shock protein Hsp20 [Desulfuromonas acetoxidans DSM 684]MBF0646814.1 Hsp20/alpha crystallin family protein [Desulfuromonas acetoxidans]NVD24948.1 Hsp20/alpha crystallin family protein [Desulfuromonas acetoxidans]NVE15249.1 Hsp20/alpha crystallin family protein [Desulfuromonas acetoxidans]
MARFDLFNEMDLLRREVDDAFRNFGFDALKTSAFLPGIGTGDYPRLNVTSDDDAIYVEALVPGITPDDLELNVMQNTLTLSGERKQDNAEQRTWHRRERGAGRFMRTIELPASIDTGKVEANYSNGILSITLPKAEHMKARKISVQAH